MKFYAVWQNNSGGRFIQNDDVDHIVCVESSSPERAERILKSIVENHSGHCECCGVRWYINFYSDDGFDFIHDSYGNNLESLAGDECRAFAIIYYANGDKKRYDIKMKSFTDLGKWI